MRNSICFIALIIALTGCTPWPHHARGGYANEYIFTPPYQKALSKSPFRYMLTQRLYALSIQTIELYHSHAGKCYPARLKLLQDLKERIAQELDAMLLLAAESDLNLYENNLVLFRKLNHNRGCPRPNKDPAWEYLKSRAQ